MGTPSAMLRWGRFLDTAIEGDVGIFVDEPNPALVARAVRRLASDRPTNGAWYVKRPASPNPRSSPECVRSPASSPMAAEAQLAMRIVLVASAYAPAIGGVEQLTNRLAAHLVAAGDEVEVWTMRHPADLAQSEVIDGVVVRRFPFYLPPAQPRPLLRLPYRAVIVLRAMRRAAAEFRPDVVHVQCFGVNGVYATALARLEGLPLVITLQGETLMDDHDIYERSVSLRTGLRLALRSAAVVTACSQFVLDDTVARFGRPLGAAEVIFNGVDTEPDQLPVPLGIVWPRYVLGLGRLVHKKGFDLLLDAFAGLPDDLAEVAVVIGGGGSELAALRRKADELGLGERAIFPGPLSRSQVAGTMGEADVFVLPSRIEPFGIVTLEAMTASTPVLVSSIGGAPEIVRHGIDGLTVDPTDRAAFRVALTTMLRDGGLRERLGEAGRRRAAAFTWPTLTDDYRQIYREVISARVRRPRDATR